MSLVVAIKGPDGLVLATDGRKVDVASGADPADPDCNRGLYVTTDDECEKLFTFAGPHTSVAVAVYGLTMTDLGARIAAELPLSRITVYEYAARLGGLFVRHAKKYPQCQQSGVVVGFDEGDPIGRVCIVDSGRPEPVEHHVASFGITYGGFSDVITRLLQGISPFALVEFRPPPRVEDLDDVERWTLRAPYALPIPLSTMSLARCVDLATFLIRTTIETYRFTDKFQGCGGPINVAMLTAGGAIHVEQRARDLAEPTRLRLWQRSAPDSVTTCAPPHELRSAMYTVPMNA